jgi:hypothetical protein
VLRSTSNPSKRISSNDWQLDRKAQSYSLDFANASNDSRGIIAIQLSNNLNVVIAFIDAIIGKMAFSQFEDNEYLSYLESLIDLIRDII